MPPPKTERLGNRCGEHMESVDRKRRGGSTSDSERKYREFFEHNLAGTFRSTLDGRLLECNVSFAGMLGYGSQEEILSHSAWDLYFDRADREAALERLRARKVIRGEEFVLRRKDGTALWILANRTLSKSDRPPVIEGSIVDITAQKRAEADIHSLLNISKKLNSVLDANSLLDSLIVEAMALADAELGWSGLRTPEGMVCQKCFRGSQPVSLTYCWPPGVGWPGWVLVHGVPYVTNDAAGDKVIVSDIRRRFRVKSGIDTPLLNAQGEVIGFFEVNNKRGEAGFTPSDTDKMVAISQIASVALQNVLAFQKIQRNEKELRQLSARLLRLQDEERRRLARELHGSTGQILASLGLKIGLARRSLGADKQGAFDALSECAAMAKRCSDELRTLAYLLHPPLMDEKGLPSALRWYAQGFSKRSGVRIKLDLPSDLGRLPQDVEMALFRTVQESLTNVQLHSGSKAAWIKVTYDPSEVVLEIRDEGRGIPPKILRRMSTGMADLGVGIAGMRERVRQLGGRLSIDSENRGTKVYVVLPLHGGTSS